MKYPFVNREKELNFLKDKYSSGSSELIIIYGRRRVGKTVRLHFKVGRIKYTKKRYTSHSTKGEVYKSWELCTS
ncbi:MAG: ATP-binding protein [Methanosarcinales archaeon]|nr:ATP-binding protein [Methanosarcinales archaeon]